MMEAIDIAAFGAITYLSCDYLITRRKKQRATWFDVVLVCAGIAGIIAMTAGFIYDILF